MIKASFIGIIAIIALAIVGSSFGTIETGTRGVKYKYGVATEVVNEGIYFTTPFTTSVRTFDIRTQKADVKALASSKDLQTVTVDAVVNYSLDPALLIELVRTVGEGYVDKILTPAIQESVKSVTAKYTAEELITKREEVRTAMQVILSEKMRASSILISGINITNLEFSDSFNKAIEAKVTAEQEALTAKNQLSRIEYEGKQKVATANAEAEATVASAKAQAEAIKIQSEAIQKNGGVEYVKLQAINKWNGQLPTYQMGDATPIISLK